MATLISLVSSCRHRFYVAGCIFLLSSVLGVRSANSAPLPTQFAVVTLGTLNNPGSSTVLRRVNSLGEVVGGFNTGNSHQASAAFIISLANGLDLITDQQDTDFSAAYGIDDTGEVAGDGVGILEVPLGLGRETEGWKAEKSEDVQTHVFKQCNKVRQSYHALCK